MNRRLQGRRGWEQSAAGPDIAGTFLAQENRLLWWKILVAYLSLVVVLLGLLWRSNGRHQ
jgi:hypothetical protein